MRMVVPWREWGRVHARMVPQMGMLSHLRVCVRRRLRAFFWMVDRHVHGQCRDALPHVRSGKVHAPSARL